MSENVSQAAQTRFIYKPDHQWLMYLALHGNAGLAVTSEAVNLDQEIWLDILKFSFSVPGYVGLHQNELWKHGAGGAAADRSQGFHSGR